MLIFKFFRPLALRAVKALERLYGTEYQVGSGADLLYEASGSSHDYAKGVLNIPFSFLVELRPQNTLHSTGFLLPEAEIMDTADETWEAIKIVADKMLERYAPLPPIETSRGRNLMGITSSTEIEGNEHCSTSTTQTIPTTPSIKTSSNTSTLKTTIKTTRRKNNKNSPSKPTKKTTTPTTTEVPTNQTLIVNTTTETTTPTTLMTSKNTSPPSPPTTSTITTISVPSSSLNSSSIRNTISNKLENLIPWASIESRNKIRSKNNRGGIRKTIVNVKICTGGRGGKSSGSSKSWETLLTFPPKGKSSEEEEEEDVEDELPEKTRKSREQNSEEEGEEDIEENEEKENKGRLNKNIFRRKIN
ncbi:unnamed protein product [Meloidogyne enterolobii]|uniref:Uncharacterized protein n=1 Tax=Meloidogyne enterolobii TaxID=390850 RepID=A0ACB0YMM3_MELEN